MNGQFRGEVLRGALTLAAVILAYYAVPVGQRESTLEVVVGLLGLLVGIGFLAWRIVVQVRRQLDAGGETFVRVQSLVLLLYLVVPIFALGYFMIESSAEDQFAEMQTKTDALYFTMSTLGTVGFGDVHATGQLARALVTIQIAFNLVFVATLVTVLSTRVRRNLGVERR